MDLLRRKVAQCFSRTIVEESFDSFDVFICDLLEACFLGEILADEAIGVFDGSSFPAGIGTSEKDLGVELSTGFTKGSELKSVVIGLRI